MAKKFHNFKSRTTGELIPAVVVEFHDIQNLYMTKGQYEQMGGYRGFLKSQEVSPRWIKKVHKILLNPDDFPEEEWNPLKG